MSQEELEMPSCGCTDIKTGLLIVIVLNLVGGILTVSTSQSLFSGALSFLFSMFGFYAIYAEKVGLMRVYRTLVLVSLVFFNIAMIIFFVLIAQLQKEKKDINGIVDTSREQSVYTYYYVFGAVSLVIQNIIKILIFVQIGKFVRYVVQKTEMAERYVQMVQPFGYPTKPETVQLPPYAYQGEPQTVVEQK